MDADSGGVRKRWKKALLIGSAGLVVVVTPLLAGPYQSARADTQTMIVNPYQGTVTGRVEPSTSFTVNVAINGQVKSSVSGVTGTDGSYSVNAGYNPGHGPGIHNGDVVTLVVGSTTYTENVQLSGYLDENTGLFSGHALPNAQVSAHLYTNGDMATLVTSQSTTADSVGNFSINFAAVTQPTSVSGHPPWRGYEVLTNSTDIPGQEVVRPIQTPNTTLDGTSNLAGGGYFIPGDHVSFSLSSGGSTLATAVATADADGIPQATLPIATSAGDVLTTSYHDTSGATRTQTLDPWQLSATIDPAHDVISGTTTPLAPIEARYIGPSGIVGVTSQATSSGTYSLNFGAQGTSFEGNRSVTVDSIADPTFTGVGALQIDARTPAVSLQDIAAKVSGYGTPGVNSVKVKVVRNGLTVASGSGTTARDGGFVNIPLGQEAIPGDLIEVTTGAQALPVFKVGSQFTAVSGGPSPPGGWNYSGTGTPGREVELSFGMANGTQCLASALVDAAGDWSTLVTCPLVGNEYVQVIELATAGSDGTASGSNLLHFQNVAAPTVSIVSPVADAAVRSSTTVSISAWDNVSDALPSKVWLQVDSSWIQAVHSTGSVFTVNLTLRSGRHTIIAYAYSATGAVDSSNHAIYAQTPPRQLIA